MDEVDAYFKRRELNRLWRRKENPDFMEHEARRQAALERQIREQFERFAEADLAGRLNWLLMKLSGPVSRSCMGKNKMRAIPAFSQKISDEAKRKIRVTDGGREGSRLTCRLSDGEVLKTPWPPGLRRAECAAARVAFETALARVRDDIRIHQEVRYDNHKECVKAVNGLFATLEDAYPQKDRKDLSTFLEYNGAKTYVRSLMAQTVRTISTCDPSVFAGSLHFDGHSVGDVIAHMSRLGVLLRRRIPARKGRTAAC